MSGDVVMGIDIGGSGIKGAPVHIPTANMTVSQRMRIPTPQPSTPEAVAEVIGQILDHFSWEGSVGCTFPAIVRRGVVLSAANVSDTWIGIDAEALFSRATGREFHVLNDADAAGIAEVDAGAAKDVEGVVILLTFGTGIGSAVLLDGALVPNTEFGHVEFKGDIAERYAAARLVEDESLGEAEGLELDVWAERVNEYLHYLDRILSPDLFVIGGGISKEFDEFSRYFDTAVRVVPAELRNNAGIVGAALAAQRRFHQ